jgi:GH25 family lysozyme M1 (1,4-beta-N-acetylmuramidase)
MKRNLSLITKAKIAFATTLNIYEYPDPSKVSGLSTSLWSGHIDMAMARDRGIRFVFIKFMDGKTIDPLAEANYKAAIDAHLLVSGYAWLYSAQVISPGGAARAMLDFLRDHPVHIRPIVDYEWNRINPNAADLDGFSIPFANVYGKRPMVYSAPGYVNQFYLPLKFDMDPNWEANYAHGKAVRMPPWSTWDFLQWSQTGDGAYYGYPSDGEKACELNYWWGNPDDLLDFCDTKPDWIDPPPLPEPPPVVVTPPPDPTPIPTPAPQPNGLVTEETWFDKVIYQKWHTQDPHDITYHLVKIDIADLADVLFDDHVAVAETSTFLQRSGAQIAINGLDGFTSKRKGRNIITSIIGFAACHGRSFGKLGPEQTLFISQDLQFSLSKPASIWSACSYPNLLILNGQVQQLDKVPDDIRARTAIGITQDGKTLILLVVDGGDYWVKVGASFMETANILLQNGAWLGIMGDGGGSTTLVRYGDSGKPIVVNKPSGENADGQRSVAIHCGFRIKT